jgi:hypothetical protein
MMSTNAPMNVPVGGSASGDSEGGGASTKREAASKITVASSLDASFPVVGAVSESAPPSVSWLLGAASVVGGTFPLDAPFFDDEQAKTKRLANVSAANAATRRGCRASADWDVRSRTVTLLRNAT